MKANPPHQNDFLFLDPGELRDQDFFLRLTETWHADPKRGWAPHYQFSICLAETGQQAGQIQLRIGNSYALVMYGGHIGYSMQPEFRGRRIVARAIRLLLPLARQHSLSEIWITCNPDNVPSRRICESVGATLVDVVQVPTGSNMYAAGDRQKCRYRLPI